MPVLFSRVDEEIEAMAKRLAEEDQRSVSSEIAWLIRQEWTRRHGNASPVEARWWRMNKNRYSFRED